MGSPTETAQIEPAISATEWDRRQAACDRMEQLAREFLDPETESANWLVSGWGRSIVKGSDVRQCREWLMVRQPDPARQRQFHDLLASTGVLGSSHGHDATRTDYTPRY